MFKVSFTEVTIAKQGNCNAPEICCKQYDDQTPAGECLLLFVSSPIHFHHDLWIMFPIHQVYF